MQTPIRNRQENRTHYLHKTITHTPPEFIKSLTSQYGSPLALLSLDAIEMQYKAMIKALPRVHHHYALKPLPHPEVVSRIRDIGGYFDIATSGEIEIIEGVGGIDPTKCIHSHPYKKIEDIKHALEKGISTFVFDCKEELEKFTHLKDKARLLMRISFPNQETHSNLSAKFGVHKDNSLDLLRFALTNGFNVVGISFHVGSQMPTSKKHVEAIMFCKDVFEYAQISLQTKLDILDIGGGFPIDDQQEYLSISDFCKPICDALDSYFPDTYIISEPGRCIAGPSITLVMSVIGTTSRNGKDWYYLDDGLYGSYLGILHDHGQYLMYSMKELENPNRLITKLDCALTGPTCDSFDMITDSIHMPKMEYGDLIVSPNMGAYTTSTSTDFNLFPKAKILLVDELKNEWLAKKLLYQSHSDTTKVYV
jgi:ornithine decarboxylase